MNGITTFISRGAEIAFSRGMIVVASAGNEGGTSNPHIERRPMRSVLAIGAVNSSESFFQFSSYDGRIKPDVMAQGVSAVLSNQFGNIVTANGTLFLVLSWLVWLFLLAGIRKQIKKSER
jgi:hypothetical protein